ncbi:MAG: hypothetical protein Q9187_001447 [Circinaria calcarea]
MAPRRPLIVNLPSMSLSEVVDGSTRDIEAETPRVPDKPQGYIPKPKPDVRAFLHPPLSAPATPTEVNDVRIHVGGKSRRKVTSTPARADSQSSTPEVNNEMLIPTTPAQTDQSIMGNPFVIGTTGLRPQVEVAAVPTLGRVVSQQVIIENTQDEQDDGANGEQAPSTGSSFETDPFAGQSPYTGPELLLPVTFQPGNHSSLSSDEERRLVQEYHSQRQQREQNEHRTSRGQLEASRQTEFEANGRLQADGACVHEDDTTGGIWENNPNVGYSLPPFSPRHPSGQRLYPVDNQTSSAAVHQLATAPIPIYLDVAPISTSLDASGPVFGSANSWAPPNQNLNTNTSASGNSFVSSDGQQSAIVPPLFAGGNNNLMTPQGYAMFRNSFAPVNGQLSTRHAQNMAGGNVIGSANSWAQTSANTNPPATVDPASENAVAPQQSQSQNSASGSRSSDRNQNSNQQPSNNPDNISGERRSSAAAAPSTGENVIGSTNSRSVPNVQTHGGVYGNSFASSTGRGPGTTAPGFPNGFGLNVDNRGYVPAPPHSYQAFQQSTGPISPEFEAMEARLHHHIDFNFNRARTIIIDGRDRVIDQLFKKFDEVVDKMDKLATSKDVGEVRGQVRSLRDDANASKKSSADISDAIKHVKDVLKNAGVGGEGVVQMQVAATNSNGRPANQGHERDLSATNTGPGNVIRSQASSTSNTSPHRRQSSAAPPTSPRRSLHGSSQYSPRRANSTTGNSNRSRMQVIDMTAPGPAPDIRNHPAYAATRRSRTTSNARLQEIVGDVLSGAHGPIPIHAAEGERPIMFEVPNFRNGAWFEQARRQMNH